MGSHSVLHTLPVVVNSQRYIIQTFTNTRGEGGLLTEIKAPVSTHELKSIHQLSSTERLWSSCGRAGEGEQAEGQVEEVRRGHDVHLYLQKKQRESQVSSLVLARGVGAG